ncbi:MoaD/ThiS family protein [Edaphobacter flagellatus]|uniref:MoaD/ThiS family protein n=1 Tax=Edaphobacter flagellatus TaxID=1933044 RepID=UPI0021B409F7|nr:MoaD/ThiS family protein [Edaphobacter flagellatus]
MNIHIPTPLRAYTGGAETVSVPGTTVAEVFTALTTEYPELKQQLFNTEGKLRSFVNVYVNDEDLRYLPSKDATQVAATDELTIIPSIAGGSAVRASRNSLCCSCCPLL